MLGIKMQAKLPDQTALLEPSQNGPTARRSHCSDCWLCRPSKDGQVNDDDEESEGWLPWLAAHVLRALGGGSATLTAFMLFLGMVMAIVGASLQVSLGADATGADSHVVTFENGNTTNIWTVMYAASIALFMVPLANAVNFVILGTLRWYLFAKVFIVVLYVSAFDNGPLTVIIWAIGAQQVAIKVSGLPPLGALSGRLLVLFMVCGFVLGLKNLLIAILQGHGVLEEFKVKVQEAVQKLVVLQNLSAAAVSLAAKRSRLLKQFYAAQQDAVGSSAIEVEQDTDETRAVLQSDGSSTSKASFTRNTFASSRHLGGLAQSTLASMVPAATVITDATGTGSAVASVSTVHDGAGVASVFPTAVGSLPAAALQSLPPLPTSRGRARGGTLESIAAVGTTVSGGVGSATQTSSSVLAVVNESGLLSTLPVATPALTGGTTSRARPREASAGGAASGTTAAAGSSTALSPTNPRQRSTRRMQRTLSMAVVLQPARTEGAAPLSAARHQLLTDQPSLPRGSGSRALVTPSSATGSMKQSMPPKSGTSDTFFVPESSVAGGDSTGSFGADASAAPASGAAAPPASIGPPPKIDTRAQDDATQETTQVFFDLSDDESVGRSTPTVNAEDLRDVQLEETNYAVLSDYIEAGQFSLFDATGRIVAIRNAAHAKRIIHGIFTALDAKNSGTIARDQLLWDGDGWSSPLGPGWSDESVEAAFITIDAANAVSFSRADLIQFTESAVSSFQALRGTLHSLSTATQALNLMANLLLSFVFIVFAVLLLGINVQPLLVSISAVVLSLSFAFARSASNFVDSAIFVLVTRPYDLGDRVRFNNSVAMYVKKMDLYSTTFERNDGTQVVFANTVLTAGEIRNERRSGYASIQVAFDLAMDATPEQLEALASAAVVYVRDRPTSWRSGFISFQIYTINTERNSFSAGFWLRHKLPFQNSSVVNGDASRFMLFLAKTLQRLELRYSLPAQPVQIRTAVAEHSWRQLHDVVDPPADASTRTNNSGATHGFAGMTDLLNQVGASRLTANSGRAPPVPPSVESPSSELQRKYADALQRLQAVESAAKEWKDIVLGDVSRMWRPNTRKFTGSAQAGAGAGAGVATDEPLQSLLQAAATQGAQAVLDAMREQHTSGASAPLPASLGGTPLKPGAAASAAHRWEVPGNPATNAQSLPVGLEDMPMFGPSNRIAHALPPQQPQRHGLDVHNRVRQFGGFEFKGASQAARPPPPAGGSGGSQQPGPKFVRSASWSRGDRMGITEGGKIASGVKRSSLAPSTPTAEAQPGLPTRSHSKAPRPQKRKSYEV